MLTFSRGEAFSPSSSGIRRSAVDELMGYVFRVAKSASVLITAMPSRATLNALAKERLKPTEEDMSSHFTHVIPRLRLVQQIVNIFAKELHRYMNHLHRQGGRMTFENEPPKNAHFIFLHTENLSLRKNEISSVKETTNVYQYKEFFEEYSPNQLHNIALHDLSKKKKHQNRRQRISTILDIWAKLRYID